MLVRSRRGKIPGLAPPLLDLFLFLAVPFLAGCSVRGLAVRALGNALAGAGDVFASDEDPELVREAVPFALKTMEALLAEQPDNRYLLLGACKGFVQYAYAFVETDALFAEAEDYAGAQVLTARALALYLRGREYCLRSLELARPGVRTALARQPEEGVAGFGVGEVPLLFWTGAAWGAAIGVGADRPDLVADVPAVKALIGRALELDEDWNRGAAHAVMIALEALPAEMGGSPERARQHFARALELDGGRRAGTYVSLATTVVEAEQDWREFRVLLEQALAVDPDAEPSARVENLIAQKRARFLLEHTGDYFLDYTSAGHGTSADSEAATLLDTYLERSFSLFPTRATAAGRHDRDRELEDLTPERRAAWVAFNAETATAAAALLAAPDLGEEERLDLELVRREAERERFSFEVLDRPGRDPLFWTGIMGDATVFLLVRDDRPMKERLWAAAERAALLPRLAAQARETLAATDPGKIAPELVALAARQAAASAAFYRDGFAGAAADDAELAARLGAAGAVAAPALEELARFLEELAGRATGDPRLGANYGENFRLVTGVEQPVAEVLAGAEEALAAKRSEAAAYGRSVWGQVLPGKTAPADDVELLRELFHRVAADRAATVEEFVVDYRQLVANAIDFVRERGVIELPDPFPIVTDRSPAFFVGQSVGGVYPPGPWSPQAATLWFLPTPAADASPADRDAFFRDFNHHFNVMITPHEIVPGHATQLVWAAHHPRKARALFGDGVYIEGWGTFCERLFLDLGWGGPLDRLAHLKKQMENIARTIVDIRVHTQGMRREEVLAFVEGEALQDEQFAGNMWRRAITNSPQITFYWLGYREVFGLYEDVRRAQAEAFDLARFMNGMMELGPVSVTRYRERLLGAAAATAERPLGD